MKENHVLIPVAIGVAALLAFFTASALTQDATAQFTPTDSRIYEAYVLENYFCTDNFGGKFTGVSDAQSSIQGTEMSTRISCQLDDGSVVAYDLTLDQRDRYLSLKAD